MRPPLLLLLTALILAPAARGLETSGFVAFEGRLFFDDQGMDGEGVEGQAEENASAAFQLELDHRWGEGKHILRFTPFARWDGNDPERTHLDVRELYWHRVARDWELAVGVRKIFWGVTEAVHLVDVINQTDLIEDLDGEQKLGQPMVQLKLLRDWGTLDLFLMTGFRERTFPGPDGRLRTPVPVDGELTEYESSAERWHLDWAVRWSHYFGPVDVGISHFSGTGREPRLVPATGSGGEDVLQPIYEQIDQTGLDFQATVGAWLWKLEAIVRQDALESFVSAIGGFEYTFFDLRGSGLDVGVLTEYYDDGREGQDPALFLGGRLTFNDIQDTNLLFGGLVGLEDDAIFLNVEGNRRLGQSWRLGLRLRAFLGIPEGHPLSGFRQDDYLQLEISRYF